MVRCFKYLTQQAKRSSRPSSFAATTTCADPREPSQERVATGKPNLFLQIVRLLLAFERTHSLLLYLIPCRNSVG
jgi:hypothetical protein